MTNEAVNGEEVALRIAGPNEVGYTLDSIEAYARRLQDAQPHCACGDSFTAEALCVNCIPAPVAKDEVSVPSTGIAVIAAERWRQVNKEGWSADHDAEHDAGELAAAGAAYAINAADQLHPYSQGDCNNMQPQIWPWDSKWWKPKDPIRDLARAGALIAAEIDKVLAAAEQEQK